MNFQVMNFQDWYKTMPKLSEQELRISVISWDACKNEVLKILRDNPRCDDYYYDLVDKIKEL